MRTVLSRQLARACPPPPLPCRRSPRPLSVVWFREKSAAEWDSSQQSSSSDSNNSASRGHRTSSRRDFLEARQVSLYELFDGNAIQFDLPEYQRHFSWRAKQVQELLSDLQAAFASNQEHFLGAIVTTRQGDAPGEPYYIIDGQQRLTTLVMLLSYLKAWSATQPGLDSLAERVHRMLFIPADPLNPASKARYRLQLRAADQAFFADNFIHSFLPRKYYLSSKLDSPANAAGDYHEAAASSGPTQQKRRRPSNSSSGAGAQRQQQPAAAAAAAVAGDSSGREGATALENETHWRLYCAGDVLACYLSDAMAAGLNLQDFVHYVLRACVVVLMTARDEATSFKIFSTLNGRGVDLALIDKLKPELLQALPPQQRQDFADHWTALESSLGRPSFHALFDHCAVIEQAAAGDGRPAGGATSSAGGAQASGPGTQSGFIPPGSTLGSSSVRSGKGAAAAVASNSSSGGRPVLARPDVLEHFSGHGDVQAALRQVLEYGQRLLQIRANDWAALAAEGGSAPAIAAELEEGCFFINLLADDSWQPWVLEFFYRSEDDAKRAAFLRGAELLQLYCELKQDEAFKHDRWLSVGRQLLQQPFYSDQVLAALALSADEADDFVKLLDSRELAASADEGLLAHLLLRADSINRKHLDWRRLKVEKVMPSNPPERSPWRKQKLLLPALTSDELAASAGGSSSASVFNPTRGRSSSSSNGGGGSGSNSGTTGSSRANRSRTTSSSNSGTGSSSSGSCVAADEASSQCSAPVSISNVPRGMREVRYWHEITRAHWHNRLGNQVLLQPSGHEAAAAGGGDATATSSGSSHLSADLPTKLHYYEACAADERFPEFTGGLVDGRYSRDMFSPDECRQRHADIISRLITVFGLGGAGGGI